jgi:uncharacterized membrane protein
MLPMVLSILATSLILLLVFLWLPVMGRTKALFGVALTDEMYQGVGRPAVKRYRLALVAIYAGINIAGALMAMTRGNFIYAVGAYILSVFAGVLLYSSYVRQMWPLRVSTGGTRFASSLTTRRLGNYTVAPLEIAIAILTIAPFVALAYAYPSLPARIPMHWNGFGQADRWTNKTFLAVFFLPIMAAYMQTWLFVLKRDLVQANVTVPAENAETYLRYKEQGLLMNIRLVDWARGSMGYLLGAVSLLMLATNDQYRPWLPVISLSIWCATTILLAGIVYLLYKLVKSNKELEKLTGNAVVQRESQAAGWKNGLYYYNPDDPSLLVEKLSGVGYTLNFGNKRVYIHLAFIVGMLLLSVLAVVLL